MKCPPSQKGFTLIELMVVMLVFSIIVGGLFSNLDQGQKRHQYEQDVLEVQQSARNAIDTMEREIRLAGFPKLSYYASTLNYTTGSNQVSAGFVTTSATNLIFQGDINEDGAVEVVQYTWNGTQGADLQRSAVAKGNAAVLRTLAENVRSLNFTYFDRNGVTTTTPAEVRSVRIDLVLQTSAGRLDPESRKARTISITTRALAKNI
ncbi:MAG: prepilin-type N-terminal cleavage/methylation domain-containing protein [Acidobacteriota bacterium]